jgi:tyrosyl-tRNA synthetase
MGEYYRLTTELSPGEVDAILENVSTGALAAVDAKRLLASTIVDMYYPTEASTQFIAPETARLPVTAIPGSTGESAQLEFDRVFREKGVPDEIPEFTLAADEPIWLPGALKEAGLVSSTSEGKRLIAQGAVRLEGQPVAGEELARDDLAGQVVQVGKRRFVRFVG